MSASQAMLIAPEAPAPTAMQSIAVKAITGWTWPGAMKKPTSAVKDHERHHPRLQQREVVADLRLGNPRESIDGVVIDYRQDLSRFTESRDAQGLRAAYGFYCTRGSTSN